MKKFLSTFLILFAFVSCGWQKPQTEKHFIYGKWEAYPSFDTILTFDDNNTVKVEGFSTNKKINETSYQFFIIDEKSVGIKDKSQLEYTVSITVESLPRDGITLGCYIWKSKDGKSMVDPPVICNNSLFRRVKE